MLTGARFVLALSLLTLTLAGCSPPLVGIEDSGSSVADVVSEHPGDVTVSDTSSTDSGATLTDAASKTVTDAAVDVPADEPPPCATGTLRCGSVCVDTTTSTSHCGRCDNLCTGATNGTAACGQSMCGVSCNEGFGDCDSAASNGCEADTRNDLGNCGGCKVTCTAGTHATATCANATCGSSCDMGYADCDTNPATGCEADLMLSPIHCGACGRSCITSVVQALGPTCAAGNCDYAMCRTSYRDCDGNRANGCETIATDSANCGACGVRCSGATPTCGLVGGVYMCVATCTTGETRCGTACADLQTDEANCGFCGNRCIGGPNGTASCTAGRCGIACNPGYGNCDGLPSNGCEAATTSSITNCGACGYTCAAGLTCVSGVCSPPRDCRDRLLRVPGSPSGAYTIDPDGPGGRAAYVVQCDMVTDGGGWTEIFLGSSTNLSGRLVNYSVIDSSLMSASTTTLLSFRSSLRAVRGRFARFTIPFNWRTRAPFTYQAVDQSVSVFDGVSTAIATLRYGYANFGAGCAEAWITTADHGRICLTGTSLPFYNGFATTALGVDWCTASNARWDANTCDPDLRFAIHVR